MEIGIFNERGIFVGVEGIDGSGTSTQVHELAGRIEKFDKYQSVLKTHEPWRNKEIRIKLETDRDAYSDPQETADLFVGDRTDHTYSLIKPNLLAGADVVCSRYKMSLVYQWTQGVPLERLLKMHTNRGILTPDKVYFLDVSRRTATERTVDRKRKEKFERDAGFIDKLIDNYHRLLEMGLKDPKLFGEIVVIDGESSINKVADAIYRNFLPFYREFRGLEFSYSKILNLKD
ncbi:MAG: dTMP kinase [Candidatus Pacearchaeota archaeon]|nr:dTMP kinase [Candidatus Pacearchaeota archaeon]MDE1849018.1 dTMP kinase [Nanoarchaeota archaeon]